MGIGSEVVVGESERAGEGEDARTGEGDLLVSLLLDGSPATSAEVPSCGLAGSEDFAVGGGESSFSHSSGVHTVSGSDRTTIGGARSSCLCLWIRPMSVILQAAVKTTLADLIILYLPISSEITVKIVGSSITTSSISVTGLPLHVSAHISM